MKRTLTVVILIIALSTQPFMTGCSQNGGDPTGPAIFVAAVLIAGIAFGGWFHHDHNDLFPPLKYDMLTGWDSGFVSGSILGPGVYDWYRTETLRPGDRIKIWSESEIGVRANLIDEAGRTYPTTNTEIGSNFVLEVQATNTGSFYLQVFGHPDSTAQGPYKVYYQYTLGGYGQ
ncbi:MAG: hypothetical protein NTY09_15020 [bacterium]|nr:hypothetical protein [bacterium]